MACRCPPGPSGLRARAEVETSKNFRANEILSLTFWVKILNFCLIFSFEDKIFHMDRIDCKILAELQADGRLSVTELADRIGLSVSPCHRRVRALEQSGVISGYHAHLDPTNLGLNFSALVFVTLREGDRHSVEAFENAVVAVPQVMQAQRLFGDPDYLLHVITRDLPTFQQLYDERLSALPSVQRLTSTLVMKNVVQNRPVSTMA